MIFTVNTTAVVPPGGITPAGIPVDGSACAKGSPLISTLFVTKVVPAGMLSVTSKLAG
ncbi:hypothetical protein D3C71_2238610 [compost metagenome]